MSGRRRPLYSIPGRGRPLSSSAREQDLHFKARRDSFGIIARPAPKAMAPAPGAAGSQEQGGLIDINSASAEELDKLPGVGPARAKAIISHRPYNGKDDLANRKVIPQNVYDQIKDKIIARQTTASGPSTSVGSPTAPTKAK